MRLYEIEELVKGYSEKDRYEALVERFIFSELKEKNPIPISVSEKTSSKDINKLIFENIDDETIFCTDKDYEKGQPFVLIDNAGEIILDYKNPDNFTVSRCKIPFEEDSDVENFSLVLLWLQSIKNIAYISNNNAKLKYEIS